MHIQGFTPYATENLVTELSSTSFTVRNPQQVVVVIMGGHDVYQRRIRREVRTTLTMAWVDYQGRWGMTHLWIMANGRRRLVHRKA